MCGLERVREGVRLADSVGCTVVANGFIKFIADPVLAGRKARNGARNRVKSGGSLFPNGRATCLCYIFMQIVGGGCGCECA